MDPNNWMGSGIFADSYVADVECECGFSDTIDVETDDWGTGHWECTQCQREHEVELDNPNDEPQD